MNFLSRRRLPSLSQTQGEHGAREPAGSPSVATSVPQWRERESRSWSDAAPAGISIQPFERRGASVLPIALPLAIALVASIAAVAVATLVAAGAIFFGAVQ